MFFKFFFNLSCYEIIVVTFFYDHRSGEKLWRESYAGYTENRRENGTAGEHTQRQS